MESWQMKLGIVALIIVIIGALNWGWVAITNNDLVSALNSATFKNETVERVVYGIVGLAGLYSIWFLYELNKEKKLM